jgi:predicted nucleotidyltransferase
MNEQIREGERVSRKPKDRDFIRTREDLLFCVVGYTHPPDRLLSYLKYVPSGNGLWAKGDLHFKRMIPYYSAKSVSETFSFLKKNYKKYLFHDPVNRITFPAVSYSDITEYYAPEKKLMELAEKKQTLDQLQRKAVELAEYLADKALVPIGKFGITGSILLGIHNLSVSDIDLTIYGYKNALLVKQTLNREYRNIVGPLRQLNPNQEEDWVTKKTSQFSIDRESATSILRKKWNFGFYTDKFFSIHPIKMDSEFTENYGEKEFKSEGRIEIEARVDNAMEAIFNPATYKVGEFITLKGPQVNDIREVITFESIFSDIGFPNQFIRVKGNLETVTNRITKEKYHRVVVGSGNVGYPEYIIPTA